MPPVTESTPITIRKITGSMSQYRPSPPQTPATTFWSRGAAQRCGLGRRVRLRPEAECVG